MKVVLIVDDDQTLLDEQSYAFGPHRHEYRVITATNGAVAAAILDERDVDILITDLDMPVMDGFELLALVLQKSPSVPIIVMSELESDTLGFALEAAGSTHLVHKPLAAPDTLVQTVRSVFARRARGHISGISLASFLQLLHIDKRSCLVNVRSDQERGNINLVDGEINSATCNELQGEEAFYKLLSWNHTDLELTGTLGEAPQAMSVPLQHLLIEAARRQDESNRDRPALASAWLDAPADPNVLSSSELSLEQKSTLRAAFQEILMLDGALGVTLIDLRGGACMLSECRGLRENFDRLATQLAPFVRNRLQLLERTGSDEEMESVIVRMTYQVEIFCAWSDYHHLIFYFLGERGKVDEEEVRATLAALPLRLNAENQAAGG